MAGSLNEITERLTQIIADARANADPTGFFAALFRTMLVEVKLNIDAGRFSDPERMVRLDLDLGARYFAALDAFRAGRAPSACWRVSFKADSDDGLLILQHLLLGTNAHVNFDLGISTAKVTGDTEQLSAFKTDFDAVRDIVAKVVDEVQDRVASVSPAFGLLDKLGGHADEALIGFSMSKAMERAWEFAEMLVRVDEQAEGPIVALQDHSVAAFGHVISNPLVNLAMQPIRLLESRDVAEIIDALSG